MCPICMDIKILASPGDIKEYKDMAEYCDFITGRDETLQHI